MSGIDQRAKGGTRLQYELKKLLIPDVRGYSKDPDIRNASQVVIAKATAKPSRQWKMDSEHQREKETAHVEAGPIRPCFRQDRNRAPSLSQPMFVLPRPGFYSQILTVGLIANCWF